MILPCRVLPVAFNTWQLATLPSAQLASNASRTLTTFWCIKENPPSLKKQIGKLFLLMICPVFLFPSFYLLVFLSFCLFVFLFFLSFCLSVFLSFCIFVFLSFCPDITLIKCLKGLKSQKSLFVLKFKNDTHWVTDQGQV